MGFESVYNWIILFCVQRFVPVHVLSLMIILNLLNGESLGFFTSQFVSHDVKNGKLLR